MDIPKEGVDIHNKTGSKMNSISLSRPNTPDDMDYELYAYDANGNMVN